MSEFPVDIGGVTYQNSEQLAAEMERWASARRTEHRAQRTPADRFNRLAGPASDRAPALAEAATDLLARSTDKNVLELIVHLALPPEFPRLYETLLDRLEGRGPALPQGPGMSHGSLHDEFMHKLSEWLPRGDDKLAGRAEGILTRHGKAHFTLPLLLRCCGAPDKILAQLAEARDEISNRPFLGVFTILHMLKEHPDRALEAARSLSKIPEPARKTIADQLESIKLNKQQISSAELREALGLPPR